MELRYVSVTFGTDPEFFLSSNGEIVGSEKVIPAEGFEKAGYMRLVRDGVQVEMHPSPSHCRQVVAAHIRSGFSLLMQKLEEKNLANKKFEISLAQVVTMKRAELDSLEPASRVLGCAPSLNIYNAAASVGVDGETYPVRAAGGHIHLGLPPLIYKPAVGRNFASRLSTGSVDERARLVPLFDLLVGNTAVLLDRDPLQAERRKVYGRAGEYRLPSHGIEYRTLSNFWLQHYVLQSGMFGLARMAVCILNQTIETSEREDLEKELLGSVDFPKLVRAINENDVDLAWENFEHVERFVKKFVPLPETVGGGYTLNPSNIEAFKTFAKRVQKDGLAAQFERVGIEQWTTSHFILGWERYLWNIAHEGQRFPISGRTAPYTEGYSIRRIF